MSILVRCNPITYAVHLARQAVFSHIDATPGARAALNAPITWGGWAVPSWLSLVMVAGIGVGLLGIAIIQFARSE
jgi:ABC-2 type transport system permease protein